MNIEEIKPNLCLENLSSGEVAKVLYVALVARGLQMGGRA